MKRDSFLLQNNGSKKKVVSHPSLYHKSNANSHAKKVVSIINNVHKDKDILFFILTILFLVSLLLLPSFIRFMINDGFILGSSQSYYHLRISDYVLNHNDYPSYDWLSYGGKPFVFVSSYEYCLAKFSAITGISLFYLILFLPVVLGIFSFIFAYYTFVTLDYGRLFRRVFFLLLSVSPLFLYVFNISNYYYVPFFLLSLFSALFVSRRPICLFFAFLIVMILPFFGYVIVLLCIPIFLVLYYKTKKMFFFYSFLVLFISLFYYFTQILSSLSLNGLFDLSRFNFLITDFGYVSGFSIFSLLLFVIGYIFLSHKQRIPFSENIIFIVLVIYYLCLFLFVDEQILFFVNFFVVYYATYGLICVMTFKYESKLIRFLIILLLISSIVFIPISYMNTVTKLYPGEETILAFTYIQQKDDSASTIFTAPRNGILINALSEHPSIIDDLCKSCSLYKERLGDIEKLYYTRNISLIDNFFEKYHVGYVLIDSDMKKKIWIHENQGMLFLLKNSQKFKKVYNTTNVVIYKYSSNGEFKDETN